MAPLRYILWNSVEQRVRVGWRLLLYTLFWLYAPRAIERLVASCEMHIASCDAYWLATRNAQLATRLAVVLAGAWLAARYLDRRPFAGYGLQMNRQWWIDLCFGLALGALLMTLIFIVEWLAGWVVVRTFHVAIPGVSFAGAMMGTLLLFVVVGVSEEVLARGYHLLNLAEAFSARHESRVTSPYSSAGWGWGALPQSSPGWRGGLIAWWVSSSLFGLLHIFNPNATWYTTLALMLAGLFLGLGFLLTGSLALPIGLHISWNFFQGAVFGFPVSGNQFQSATVLAIGQQGPVLWTGGAFGPEAGLLGILAILLGCGQTIWWVHWRYGGDVTRDS